MTTPSAPPAIESKDVTVSSLSNGGRAYHWRPSDVDAEGWVVHDRVINGVSGGGIFMHAAASLEETRAIAENMTRKFTVCDPQIGGAKGGIRFDHRDPRAPAVLRAFLHAMRPLLAAVWVTAGDLNTDDDYIENVIRTELGLSSCQAALGAAIAAATGCADRSATLARLNRLPVTRYFPAIEGAVGFGMAASVRWARDRIYLPDLAPVPAVDVHADGAVLSYPPTAVAPAPASGGAAAGAVPGAPPFRVAIQGFGAVGSSLAYYLVERKIATVVAIADKDGCIHHPDGLPIVEILEARASRLQSLVAAKASAAAQTECAKNLLCNLTTDQRERWNAVARPRDDQDFLATFVACEAAEVFCPCAGRYQVTARVVDALERMWSGGARGRFLVSGANNPFGVADAAGAAGGAALLREDTGKAVERSLVERLGATVVCDWVANSGTAQLFHRGLSEDWDVDDGRTGARLMESCARPIVRFLDDAFATLSREQQRDVARAGPAMAGALAALAARRLVHPLPIHVPLSAEQKVELILRNLIGDGANTLLTPEARARLLAIVAERPLRVYWGTAPTGSPHVAYFMPMAKLADFLRAGCDVQVLLADLHAELDSEKSTAALVSARVAYYRHVVEAMLESMGVQTERLRFVTGRAFQLSSDYTNDVYKLACKTSERNARKAGSEVVKQSESAPLSSLLYPLLQALDEEYLGVDAQFGGLDQRKIFVLAEEALPRLGYAKRIHLMNPMVPGIGGGRGNKQAGTAPDPGADEKKREAPESKEASDGDLGKMSSSAGDKIDLLDPPEAVRAKVGRAHAAPGEVDGNGLLAFVDKVHFAVHPTFQVSRAPKNGGDLTFASYGSVESAYRSKSLHPADLKAAVVVSINALLAPIRRRFSTPAMQALAARAYPAP